MSRLKPIERSFFSIETPSTLQTIACFCTLESMPALDSVRSGVEQSLEIIPRLRERLMVGGLPFRRSRWEVDPQFNLNNHISRIHLLGVNSKSDLLQRTAELFYRPFDFNHPLWRFLLMSSTNTDGAENQSAPPAVVLAVHHAYADGLGGLEILNTVCSVSSSRRTVRPRAPAKTEKPDSPSASPALPGQPSTRKTLRQRLLPYLGLLGELKEQVVDTALNGTNSERRRFHTIDLPLNKLNPLKRPLDATVNDILLSLLTEALRRYSRELGVPLPRSARMILPVSLRKRRDLHMLGNHITGVGVSLPLAWADQAEQVREIRRQTLRIKNTEAGKVYALFAALISLLPAAAQRRICERQAKRTLFICTNMNVSARPQDFFGSRITGNYALAALMRRHGSAFACIRYTDKICLGMVTDPAIVSRPERFLEHLAGALADLEETVTGSDNRHNLQRPAL